MYKSRKFHVMENYYTNNSKLEDMDFPSTIFVLWGKEKIIKMIFFIKFLK